ncbi:hypothetical protein Moror_2309 [Moniliophthora roreri MCA 2997]|uniref:Uncharacterized protein n=2 Tax=Moniliophthora roreri TaxID=221103 RepID=V2WZC6_MONRO|nr:hypothetical protein Moror_2309 [Moniliophthora roreri MCA 2997]KAI3610667.1 hypothetical protein WG66_007210 [Moniliophthora roreri]
MSSLQLCSSGHLFIIIRWSMLTVLFVLHFFVPVSLCISIALGSGELFLVSAISTELCAALSLVMYLLYCIRNFNVRPERQYAKVRAGDLWIFTCCGTWSLATAIILTARIHDGGLCRDFSAITKTCGLSKFVLALSWLAVSCCMIGATFGMVDWTGYDEARIPTVQTLQVPPQAPLSHKRSYRVPEAPPSPTRTIRYKPSAGQVTPTTTSSRPMMTLTSAGHTGGSSGSREGELTQTKESETWNNIPI